MLLIILGAAGAFFAIGSALSPGAQRQVSKLLATPKPSATPRPGAIYKVLYKKTLLMANATPFVEDISQPHGLGLFGDSLYVSSWGDKAIYKVDLASGSKKLLVSNVDGAHDMVMDSDGKLVVPLFHEGRVVRIDPKNGKVSELASGFDGPNGITHARDSGYYVTDASAGTLSKVSDDGHVKVLARNLKEPAGVVVDNDNIIRVAQFADSADPVIQIQDNGTTRPLVKNLTNAESLAVDGAKNLIISHVVGGKLAFSVFFARATDPQPVLQTDLPGPGVGPVTDGKYLYFESTASGQSAVYRIPLTP